MVRFSNITLTQWLHGCRGTDRQFDRDARKDENEVGARCFKDMALRCVINNRRNLAEGALENVPWVVGRTIWEICVKHSLVSTALWKEFASAYGQEHRWSSNPKYHDDKSFDAPTMGPNLLSQLTPWLIKPPGRLLTSLSLRGVLAGTSEDHGQGMTRANWVGLSNLENLAILQIDTCEGLSDQVVRAWGDRAVETGAFRQLRALEMLNQHDITFGCLASLSKITSLGQVQLNGRRIVPDRLDLVAKYGWKTLCKHTNYDDNVPNQHGNTDLEWSAWGTRICPQVDSCKAALDQLSAIKTSIALPLLRLQCSSQNVERQFAISIITVVPDRSKAAKRIREPEMAEPSRPAKKVLREGATKNIEDLFKQLAGP